MIIKTKFLSPTNTKGSRVQAKFQGRTLIVPWNWELQSYENHMNAAKMVSGFQDLEEVQKTWKGYEFREPQPECLGFKNHETAQVILQISNEKELYERACNWAREDSGSCVPWCSLIESLTGYNWKTAMDRKVKGTNLKWGSPLICRKEVIEHVRGLIED